MNADRGIGLAIGDRHITAVPFGRSDSAISLAFSPPASAEEVPEALTAVLRDLAHEIEARTGSPCTNAVVHVALLPPLVDARLVSLPPLREAEAAAVLRRDAARHFPGSNLPRTIGVRMPASALRGATALQPVFATAAPVALVDAVYYACAAAGWRIRSIVSAHAAWIAAGTTRVRTDSPVAIAVRYNETVHLLQVRKGDPAAVRRLPAEAAHEVVPLLGEGPGHLVAFDPEFADRIRASATATGWQVEVVSGTRDDATAVDTAATVDTAAAADTAAAIDMAAAVDIITAAAAHAATPHFVTPAMAARRVHRQRARARRLAAAAAVLMLGSIAAGFWDLRREIDSIQSRRAEIRREVAPLLVQRDSLLNLEDRHARLVQLESRSGRLSSALFDIAVLLPPDSYLSAFRTRGDTLIIHGLSPRAAEAIAALRSAQSFGNVRLDGIIDRELDAGATARERFTVHALLAPPRATAAPRNTASGRTVGSRSSVGIPAALARDETSTERSGTVAAEGSIR